MALHHRTRLLEAAPVPGTLSARRALRFLSVRSRPLVATLLAAATLSATLPNAAGQDPEPTSRPGGGPWLDRVLAVVNGEPITLSEVVEAIALAPAEPPSAEEALERLIDARLMERQARRYPLDPPSDSETEETLRALKERFTTLEAYRTTLLRLGIAEDYLRKRIRRELIVDRYLERRFRPLVQVAQREVEEYYRTVLLPDLDAGSPMPVGEVEALIRNILEERDLNRRISEWVDELKSTARIVRLPPVEPPPAN